MTHKCKGKIIREKNVEVGVCDECGKRFILNKAGMVVRTENA